MVEFKLATVKELFEDGTAKIQFLGEDTPSEKEYSYLASYMPTVEDKVFLLPFAGSYVIIGKLLYMETPGGGTGGYVTAEELTETLKGYAAADHSHSGYAAANHSHSEYAAASHTHSGYAASGHTHSYLKKDGLSYTIGWANSYSALICTSSNFASLGHSNYKWSNIYATTSAIGSSDRNLKKNIQEMKDDGRYERMFSNLIPVCYQFRENESNRVHIGFIAQDVADAMKKVDISSREFAGYIEMPINKKDENGEVTEEFDHMEYGLRYEEFIALNTMMIQKALDKIESLESRIAELEG